MKIGIFTNNYLPNPYGVTGSIESFRHEFEAQGHQVFIFAPKWQDYKDDNPNIFRFPSVTLPLKFRYPLPIIWSPRMKKIIEALELDIIHAQHPNLLGSTAKLWSKKKNIPLVFTWHTLYDQYTNFIPLIPKKWAADWIIKKAVSYANRADQIIVPTESIKKIVIDWGVVNKNIIAIPTGVEEKYYQNPDRAMLRNKYKIIKNEIVLVLVSRLTEEKNIVFLFEAVLSVLKKYSNLKFLVVGEGYLVPDLRKMVVENNLTGQIIFTGLIGKEEIKNYYAAGDIFVYASKSETQGMIISEAMYCGLPIVALEATGVKDAVENNRNGFLTSGSQFDFVQALEKLIRDENLRRKMRDESIKIAKEKYTARVSTAKMLEVYNGLLKR